MSSPEPKKRKVTITSVNTQGSKGSILTAQRQRVASAKGPTFAMVQEAGKPPPSWNLTPHPSNPRIATGTLGPARPGSRRKPVYVAVQYAEGRKAKQPARNNQFIFSNQPFEKVEELSFGRTGAGLRPPLAVETRDMVAATVHQPSGAPAFAAAQTRDQWGGLKKRAGDKPFAMVGDMNMSSKRLRTAVKASKAGGTVVSPPGATQQSGGTLDHGIFSVPDVKVGTETAMAGDHTPQRYELSFSIGKAPANTGRRRRTRRGRRRI